MAVYFLLLTLSITSSHLCICSPFPSPSPPTPAPPGPPVGPPTPAPPGPPVGPPTPAPPGPPVGPPTLSSSELTFGQEWGLWKLHNEKRYETDKEESFRRDVWMINKMYIEEHNAKNAEQYGYTLAMNHFGDLVSVYVYILATTE